MSTGSSFYTVRERILNKTERELFHELKKLLPENFHVFPNMRIADMIDAVEGKGFVLRRNQILPKHVDFLICNASFEPQFAIELNGSSHNLIKRKIRDSIVRTIFASAGLPLFFIRTEDNFTEEIIAILAKHTL